MIAPPLKPKRKLWGIKLLQVIAFYVLLQSVAAGAVFISLERSLRIDIHGFWVPWLGVPSFSILQGQFNWKNKVTFLSGNLKVDYNLLTLLRGQGIRIRVSGGPAEVQLEEEWAEMQGVQRARLDQFVVGIDLGAEGIKDVHQLDVISKVFQFHLSSTEKKINLGERA